MSKHAFLALAAALLPVLAAGAARADGTSDFEAANAAQLRGYTASPAQIFVSAGGPSARPAAPAPHRPKAPARSR